MLNKIIPNDFNWELYINLNPDLININNKNNAENHYLKYGINENRLYKINNKINDKINNKINDKINNKINDKINKNKLYVII